MNKLLLAILIIGCTSCGNEQFTCICKNGDKEIANYKIDAAKKSTASFECNQKQLGFSGNPEFKDVQCGIE